MVSSCSAYDDTANDRYCLSESLSGGTSGLATMRRKDFDPPVHAAICSKHFVGGEKVHIDMHTCQGALCVWHLLDFIFRNTSGKKSVDPDSPAHVPFIFELDFSLNKRRAEISMTRYEAAKKRRECNDAKADFVRLMAIQMRNVSLQLHITGDSSNCKQQAHSFRVFHVHDDEATPQFE